MDMDNVLMLLGGVVCYLAIVAGAAGLVLWVDRRLNEWRESGGKTKKS